MEFLPVTWPSYFEYVTGIAGRISLLKDKPDRIIGIARCGLTLGHLLSDLLGIPVSVVGVSSYSGVNIQGKLKLTDKLTAKIQGKHVLVVDGISDSGKTLRYVSRYLSRFGPRRISTATIFVKPRTSFIPDFYADRTDKWILFPYESAEWITYFFETMRKEGKDATAIETFLFSLGYTEEQIAFVKKVRTIGSS